MIVPRHLNSTRMDRFIYINDDKQKLTIPIGPRFQADVPEWTGPRSANAPGYSKWLGIVTWPTKYATSEIDSYVKGKGRPISCDCTTPGSIQCVKFHVSNKASHLQSVLGPAFQIWKFDKMGEGIAKLWEQQDQRRLTYLMEDNLFSKKIDFTKPALECFPSKSKKDIIDFYFNVYIPRRMSIQTRSRCMMVNTDNDEEENSKNPSKRYRKKARVECITVYNPKDVKSRYLVGR